MTDLRYKVKVNGKVVASATPQFLIGLLDLFDGREWEDLLSDNPAHLVLVENKRVLLTSKSAAGLTRRGRLEAVRVRENEIYHSRQPIA